ncbi:MAG: biotin--[acetyl-CoA-carboxylase] ligase [Oscillospiraceae bacterium]|nr:biotin--[acetyl-CoA-carboxylase] ligase [Oscillospiraceae bacterium]
MTSKMRILQELEKKRGENVSGEELAGMVGISRAGIWKAVNELKKEGYHITAVTNKGYCLCSDNDILSSEGIRPHLFDRTAADHIMTYKTLESTNKTAKELAAQGAQSGTVILSEHQSSGRGRMGRGFFSPANSGIYMSVILRLGVKASDAVLITTAASVAVAKAIEEVTGIYAEIKWVNDLYVEGKKICGILTEAVTDFESGNIEFIVLGIGINFATKSAEFPTEILDKAGSLYYEDPPNGVSRNRLAAHVINHVLRLEDDITSKSFLEEYKKRSFVLGKPIKVIKPNETRLAKAVDVDSNGGLVVEYENGEIDTLSSGEISIRTQ